MPTDDDIIAVNHKGNLKTELFNGFRHLDGRLDVYKRQAGLSLGVSNLKAPVSLCRHSMRMAMPGTRVDSCSPGMS